MAILSGYHLQPHSPAISPPPARPPGARRSNRQEALACVGHASTHPADVLPLLKAEPLSVAVRCDGPR
jgi:hypothetical protein